MTIQNHLNNLKINPWLLNQLRRRSWSFKTKHDTLALKFWILFQSKHFVLPFEPTYTDGLQITNSLASVVVLLIRETIIGVLIVILTLKWGSARDILICQ